MRPTHSSKPTKLRWQRDSCCLFKRLGEGEGSPLPFYAHAGAAPRCACHRQRLRSGPFQRRMPFNRHKEPDMTHSDIDTVPDFGAAVFELFHAPEYADLEYEDRAIPLIFALGRAIWNAGGDRDETVAEAQIELAYAIRGFDDARARSEAKESAMHWNILQSGSALG